MRGRSDYLDGSGLTPTDITLQVYWSQVVSMVEIKPVLASTMYKEVLGQIGGRVHLIFEQQPGRSFCLVMVLGATSIEVLRFARPGTGRAVLRSGIQPLSADPDSFGAQLLLRFLCSSSGQHLGFPAPPCPPPDGFQGGSVESLRLRDFQLLRDHTSKGSSAVFSAAIGNDPQRVVVKFANGSEQEVRHC